MTLTSSALPAVEDLQAKARNFRVVYPTQYVALDTCCKQNSADTSGHNLAQNVVRLSTPVVGPEPDVQCASRHPTVGVQFLRECTVFRPKRFNSGLFRYRPIQRHKSNPSWWRDCDCWMQYCAIFLILLLFIAFFAVGYLRIAVEHSRLLHAEEINWFRNATFYEVFPASFKDTDSDGYGDFQGIIQKLDYIRDLGMTTVRLNSIYSALDYPLEFEHIIDLRSADPHLGHMDEFKNLVKECHDRGLKIVLDLNPTITSDQHTWALHWQRGIPGYDHFYASANRSKDPPEMENLEGPPPEDWELTQRTFGAHYVLNWSNEFVQKEFKDTLSFWINMGVDGFYMKHMENIHVLDLQEVPKIIELWRNVLDVTTPTWLRNSFQKRVLIVSSKFAQEMKAMLGNSVTKKMLKNIDLIDYPLLVGSAIEMADQISSLEEISNMEYGSPIPMWHLGSSDTFRFASRIDNTYHMAAFYLLMSLSGSSSVFYGDEIGLKDSYDVFSERVYRGGQLTPMQWKTDNSSGGFTDNMTNPWIPLNPDHFSTNVESQESRLSQLRKLINVRRHMKPEKMLLLKVISPNVIAVGRGGACEDGSKKCVFILEVNLGSEVVDRKDPFSFSGPSQLLLSTTGSKFISESLAIEPGSAYLVRMPKTSSSV